MFDRSPPTESEIERWFLTSSEVPPRTFEFALVLGCTVSAGAYVHHRASGRGVCAAIAGRALAFEFDPVARSTSG